MHNAEHVGWLRLKNKTLVYILLNTLKTTRVYFGVLQTKLCIPRTSFRDLLIWEMHSGGLTRHFGRDKTIASVEDRFYWPSLKKDVARIVAQCRTCRLAKAKK